MQQILKYYKLQVQTTKIVANIEFPYNYLQQFLKYVHIRTNTYMQFGMSF